MPAEPAVGPLCAERAPAAPLSRDARAGARRVAARGAAMLLHAGAIALLLAHPPAEERRAEPPPIPVELVSTPEAPREPVTQPDRPPPAHGPRVSGENLDRTPGQPSVAPAPSSHDPAPAAPPPVPAPGRSAQALEPTTQSEPSAPVAAPVLPPQPQEAVAEVASAPVPPPETKDAVAEVERAPPPRVKPTPPPHPPERTAALSPPPPSAQARSERERRGEGGADRYLNAVRRDILRNRIYPPAARLLGLAGTAEFAVLLDRQGRLLRLRLLQSSGAEILDKAGMGAIERSAPFRPLPPDIIGDKVELVVAVHMAP